MAVTEIVWDSYRHAM